MGQLLDFIYKVKKYFQFTPAEIRGLIAATIVIAFIISFQDWGKGTSVDFAIGAFNFFNALLIAALAIIVHISAQRLWSLATGFRLEWRMWGFGLIFSLILIFLTNGNVWAIVPGGVILHHLGGHRLGWFRYDTNFFTVSIVSLAGPLASITLAVFFTGLSAFVTNAVIQKAIYLNIAMALYSLLPIPPLDGSRIVYGSRLLYVFSACGIVATSVLLLVGLGIWLTILLSFLIAFTMWMLYYYFFESQWWQGA